jgi:signal transduction histidine kinase
VRKLFIGEVDLDPEVVRALGEAGFEVVHAKAPLDAGEGDLTIIGVEQGITSSLRHEVNNPLTAVIGFAQLLARKPGLDPALVERLEKVQTHAIRIRDLIQKPDA